MRARPISSDRLAVATALRIDDAAAFLGIGRSKLYQLIGAGKLKVYRPAGRTTLLRSDLEAFAQGGNLQKRNVN
jgi:excisionase family DNA binding protein